MSGASFGEGSRHWDGRAGAAARARLRRGATRTQRLCSCRRCRAQAASQPVTASESCCAIAAAGSATGSADAATPGLLAPLLRDEAGLAQDRGVVPVDPLAGQLAVAKLHDDHEIDV